MAYGDVDVTWQTVAFKKIKFGTRENIGQGPVDIPAQTLADDGRVAGAAAMRCAGEMKAAGYRTSEGVVGLAKPGRRGAADGGHVRQPRFGRRRRQQKPGPHAR